MHERNGGVGAAIVTGYERALAEAIDVVVRDGGRQPDGPGRARWLVEPVARGEVDYAKANRLFTGEAWRVIPRTRYLGNAVLSLLTKIASGYWHVADSQAGYTALGLEYLERLDLDRIYHRYGFPERHARAPERVERPRARLSVAADLRRRRALGDPAAARSCRGSRGSS